MSPEILAAIGSTILTVGGGAVATIKFLFTRFETSMQERLDAMDRHVTKLQIHVEECEKDRTRILREMIDTNKKAAQLKRRVDEIAPEAG